MSEETKKLDDVNATLKDVELELLNRKVARQDAIIRELSSEPEGEVEAEPAPAQ